MGAHQLGDDAATIDIANQQDGKIGRFGEPHIGDVGGPQVHFGGAAGALDQHQVAAAPDLGEAVQHGGQQLVLELAVVAGRRLGEDAPLHHHLRPGFALGLQQHRVHVTAGGQTAGQGLQGLGPPDLAAVGGHRGVVRHVLRFERGDRQAAAAKGAAQPGHQQGLADIRAGALQHQRRWMPRSWWRVSAQGYP